VLSPAKSTCTLSGHAERAFLPFEKCPKVIFVSDGLKRLGGRLEKVIFVIIILIIIIIVNGKRLTCLFEGWALLNAGRLARIFQRQF
jgi:hypothetical protein